MSIQTRNLRFTWFSNILGSVNPSEESYANSLIKYFREIPKKWRCLPHRILHAWKLPGAQLRCLQQCFTLEGSRQWEFQPYIPKVLRGLGIKTLRSSFYHNFVSGIFFSTPAWHTFPNWTFPLVICPGWCNHLFYMAVFPKLGGLLVIQAIRDESGLNCVIFLSIHNCIQAKVLSLLDCSDLKSRCVLNNEF